MKQIVCSVLCVFGLELMGAELRVGGVEFAEVDGTSRLPLEFMRTGENKNKLEPMKLSRFWIAKTPVSERSFAEVMGRPLDGTACDKPVAYIEWAVAREFCERFTKKYRAQLPSGCIASLPHMIEWAHAVRLLKGRTDLIGPVGTFLFTGNVDGGYLHTLWRDVLDDNKDTDASVDLLIIPRRRRLSHVGIQMVLVDVKGKIDGENATVSRGRVVVRHGEFESAASYFELALKRGELNEEDRTSAEHALAYIRKGHDADQEDWSGLVALSSAFAAKRGCVIEPFASNWQMAGWEQAEDKDVAGVYAKSGIVGEWVRLADLPKDVLRDQCVGEEYGLAVMVGEEIESARLKIDPKFVVQTLKCDFDGDGRRDLVVEEFGSVGSGGYHYNFYRGLPDGSCTNVLRWQVVGLCVFPRKDGKGCGFLVVEKNANPVLSVSLLTFSAESPVLESANPKPFYMLDAQEERIYMAAPFIGAGYGLGWFHLQARGIWYRPLYWPWREGTVQGYEAAKRQVGEKLKKEKEQESSKTEI